MMDGPGISVSSNVRDSLFKSNTNTIPVIHTGPKGRSGKTVQSGLDRIVITENLTTEVEDLRHRRYGN